MHVPQMEVILSHDGMELARATLPPGAYIIGRSVEADLHVQTPLLSRKHARLTIREDHLLLEDLGSSNGTFVNDKPVGESTRFFADQNVRLGDVALEVRHEHAPAEFGENPTPEPEAIRNYLPKDLLSDQRYAVGSVVARGGMGAILDAREGPTQRNVAMKVMIDTAGKDDALRFIEEAQVTAQLEHPNIVPVHELGIDERDQLFYTMKMVRGITLKKVLELMAQGVPETIAKYPLAALLTIFQKVCDAIAFAHAKGVIHRDLKPENIMLGDFGEVLVMDWGLAKILGKRRSDPTRNLGDPATARRSVVLSVRASHGDTSRTISGTIMGTPQFMSPEQARGEVDDLDARSDVYALGTILYYLLALRPSVTGKTAMEIVEKVGRGEIEPIAAGDRRPLQHLRGGRIPDSLAAVVRKAMAFDREARYPSVDALQADLAAYQGGFATSAEEKTTWKQLTLLVKRNKPMSIGIAAVLLTAVSFGSKAVIEGQRAKREADRANQALIDLRKTAPTFAAQAQSLVEQHRFEEALAALATASSLDPYRAEYRLRQGHIQQTLQHFSEAEAAYREALRREPMLVAAQQNLAITQSLAREAAGGPEQAKRAHARLQAELIRQERTAEAVFLSKDLAGDAARNYATWKPVLEKLGLKSDFQHFRALPDATLLLYVEDRTFADLRPLRGMPLGDLTIAGTPVQDLSPLQGMPLGRLAANTCSEITDISGLRGLPLRVLDLGSTKVTDISALKGMQLIELHVTTIGGYVRDVSALAGMALEKVRINVSSEADPSVFAGMPLREATFYGDMKSIEFLRGAHLTHMRVESNTVSDLSPLRGMPLISLAIERAPITDLEPLRGLSLSDLRLSRTSIANLAPLAGMPLKILYLEDCKKIRDLSVLATLTSLEQLVLPKGSHDLEALRKLPKLKRLSTRTNGATRQPAQTAEEFWAEYDTQHAKQ